MKPNLADDIETFTGGFQIPRKPAALQLAEQAHRAARRARQQLEADQRSALAAERGKDGFRRSPAREAQLAADFDDEIATARKAETEARKALATERGKYDPVFAEAVAANKGEAQRIIGAALRQLDDALSRLLVVDAYAEANSLTRSRLLHAAPRLAGLVREMRQALLET